MIKNALFATAAAALAIAPVAAQAQAANAPTVERSAKPVSKKAGQMEGGSGILIAVLAAAAVITGIVIATDSDDEAVSP